LKLLAQPTALRCWRLIGVIACVCFVAFAVRYYYDSLEQRAAGWNAFCLRLLVLVLVVALIEANGVLRWMARCSSQKSAYYCMNSARY
jgi:cell division protein FtsW (lipid II flippase)